MGQLLCSASTASAPGSGNLERNHLNLPIGWHRKEVHYRNAKVSCHPSEQARVELPLPLVHYSPAEPIGSAV